MSSQEFRHLSKVVIVLILLSVTSTQSSSYVSLSQHSSSFQGVTQANNLVRNSTSATKTTFEWQNSDRAPRHEDGGASRGGRASNRFRRLSGVVRPLHYDLFIWPRIASPFNFTGKVSIELLCREETSNITFHSKHITLNDETLQLDLLHKNNTKSVPKISKLDYDEELQHSIIKLYSPLEANQTYVLTVDFNGILGDNLVGFHKIGYLQQNASEPTWIAATKFEPTQARRAFPCFDEPSFKATFRIRIKHWKNMTAISNMPVVSSQSDDQLWATDTFAKSVSMSTYLVAYAVTNFKSRSDGNVTVWAQPGQLDSANYALKIAVKILAFYEQFFGLDYPLSKMDMIALPEFSSGAMENWGLITYRETSMLVDEKTSTVLNKKRVAAIVAHELAHQWFGNLVTPKWWDDLWLNEGFASFVEYLGMHHVEPDWKMMERFNDQEMQHVMVIDALSSTHQVSVAVDSPDQITELFDSISYAKGACICRMMMNFLTEPIMKKGLHNYLSALKYANAEQADLWRYLASALPPSDQIDVANVMNSWTLQAGYPLVTLKRRYDNSRKATLEQNKYQSYKKASTNVTKSTPQIRWEIPITYTWRSDQNWDTKTRLWMHQNDSELRQVDERLMPVPDDEWILLNIKQEGFYRVNYDERNWQLLVDQLNKDHSKIIVSNRAQIMTDLLEMAQSGLVSYRLPMEATKYLTKEQDYIPWHATLELLSDIHDLLQGGKAHAYWISYLQNLLEPLIARYRHKSLILEPQNETLSSSRLNDLSEASSHSLSITWAREIGDKFYVDQAKLLFAQWKSTGVNKISPMFRNSVYCSAIQHGSESDWNFLSEKHRCESDANERDRLMKGLTCASQARLLERLLNLTFDSGHAVRLQDGPTIINLVSRNRNGSEIASNFVRANWSTLVEIYGSLSFAFSNIVKSLGRNLNTENDLKKLREFHQAVKNNLATGRQAFEILLEKVESFVAWRKRNDEFFYSWLKTEAEAKIKSQQ